MIRSACHPLNPLVSACVTTCSSARDTSRVMRVCFLWTGSSFISERIYPSAPPVPRVPPTELDLGDKAQHIVPRRSLTRR